MITIQKAVPEDAVGIGKGITVEVATYNTNAIEFYKRLGFEDTGKRFSNERLKMKSSAVLPEMEMVIKANGRDTLRL